MAAFGTVAPPPPPAGVRTVVEDLALAPVALGPGANAVYFQQERLQRGDTIAALLERLGVDDDDIARLLRSAAGVALRALHIGTVVQAQVDGDGALQSLSFLSAAQTLIRIERSGARFVVLRQAAPLERRIEMKSGVITRSLFAATDAAGVPDSVALQLADIFSGDVDFHRDLQPGDRFAVVYEHYFYEGRPVRAGRVLAAEFDTPSRALRALWYDDGTRSGYYTPQGASLRKKLLRSPLEFSRITSGFGMRWHPILDGWRKHQGVDYAAPIGTRVKATGDGIVEFAGRRGGYGNVIVLRHPGGLSTWYAHLSGFARAIRRGARVQQGQVIGYVGQSGLATGPHLHYELRVNHRDVNPLSFRSPAASPLPARELPVFRQSVQPLLARLALLENADLAQLE